MFDGFGSPFVYFYSEELSYGPSCVCARFSLGIILVRLGFSHER